MVETIIGELLLRLLIEGFVGILISQELPQEKGIYIESGTASYYSLNSAEKNKIKPKGGFFTNIGYDFAKSKHYRFSPELTYHYLSFIDKNNDTNIIESVLGLGIKFTASGFNLRAGYSKHFQDSFFSYYGAFGFQYYFNNYIGIVVDFNFINRNKEDNYFNGIDAGISFRF